ncbi:CIC11C00000004640 [Sungouiella intermedia]|uniref:CIC11C00000004640 n=1 Tax=Sungouiella intermedia TaxID=45354 RepID=A0A1L0BS94_9ASCO|nr:CIC11C00000004640 [[Candida] intermedia]
MLFKSLVKAAMVASAIASPVQHHQHHQHEKKAVVTHTVVVTVGAGDDAVVSTLPVVSIATPSSVTVSSQTVANGAIPSTVTSASASKATSASSSPSSSSGSFSGAAKGITYSPYNADGSCKSSSDVASDIAKLLEFEVIRLYGVDCNQVENVLPALGDNQKLFAGIYFVNDISGGVSTLAAAVKANGGWDRVHTVSIGNELVNNGEATVSQIKSYVAQGRSALTAAGYTGPVVSVDTFIAVINNPELCEYSDYMAVNAHAFFDGYVAAEDAGDWVLLQIERVATACSSKSVFITETGWPTRGDSNGVAVPSSENQLAALASISEKCGNDVTFFNAYNDLWKADGAYNAEKYWGIYSN